MATPQERWLTCLWYAWGRKDAQQYSPELSARLDVFEFATQQRDAQEAYNKEETFHLDSIQGAWQKYVESKAVEGEPFTRQQSD